MAKKRPFTENQLKEICRDLRGGASFRGACKKHKVSESVLRSHMDADPRLRQRIDAARGHAQVEGEVALFQSGTQMDLQNRRDSKAMMAWLTNRANEDWSNRQQVDLFAHSADEVRKRQKKLPAATAEKLREVGREAILGDLGEDPTVLH